MYIYIYTYIKPSVGELPPSTTLYLHSTACGHMGFHTNCIIIFTFVLIPTLPLTVTQELWVLINDIYNDRRVIQIVDLAIPYSVLEIATYFLSHLEIIFLNFYVN